MTDANDIVKNQGPDALRAQLEGLHKIEIRNGNTHIVVEKIEDALIALNAPVFYRADSLAEPVTREEINGATVRVTKARQLTALTLADLVSRRAAKFFRLFKGEKKDANGKATFSERPVDPPIKAIATLLENAPKTKFKKLVGVIGTPTMRPDGSLLTTPGYDVATGFYYAPVGDLILPPLTGNPTRAEALAGLQLYRELLSGFPFKNKKDKDGQIIEIDFATALAMIITIVVRPAFPYAPMFRTTSPAAGTGKSLLSRIAAYIATGTDVRPLVASADNEEMEKRITAAVRDARPILFLNNLDDDLGYGDAGSLLCQIVTEGQLDSRELGSTKLITIDCRGTTILANGNNFAVIGDLTRRTLTINLDAGVEKPELRKFKFDPIEKVHADRGSYVAAIFAMVRGYLASGEQVELSPFAGFKDWSALVRGTLVWLGLPDPVVSLDQARKDDPRRAELRALLAALRRCVTPVEAPFTALDVVGWANGTHASVGGTGPTLIRQELHDLLLNRLGKISAKSIGKRLSKACGQHVDGAWLEQHVADAVHGNAYRLKAEAGVELRLPDLRVEVSEDKGVLSPTRESKVETDK